MNQPSTYTRFFGLSREPFGVEPDFSSLFLVKTQKEGLISLAQGINERRGVVVLLGQRGTGKTTLLRYLQARLGKKVKTVFVSRISIFFGQILRQVAQELRLPLANETPKSFLSPLRACLAEGLGRRENLAVFVDDAHNLPLKAFEELRLLANMEEGGIKLVQIILAGQPELEGLLSAEALRPLNRQIRAWVRLQPLLPEESRLFIEERLQRAGRSTREVFTPEALDAIVSQGGGIFRRIIFLGDQAFQRGMDLQQKVIDAAIIRAVLPEMDISQGEGPGPSKKIADRDALLRRLFRNPPRIVKPNILREVNFFLKSRSSYLYILGTVVLGLGLYLAWELLLPPPHPAGYREEAAVPVAKKQEPTPAAQKNAEASLQNGSSVRTEGKKMMAPSAPVWGKVPPLPTQEEAQAKSGEKPAGPGPPIPHSPLETKREPKAELKTAVKTEVRFNEPIEVPKGKTLYAFARDYYRNANPTLVDYILEANPHIKNMDRIPSDRKIEIPEILEGSLLAQSPDGSWKIHLGTFESRDAEKAFREEPLLKAKEIESAPRQVAPQTIWYRLYAGEFGTMEEAFGTVQELRKKGLLPAFKK